MLMMRIMAVEKLMFLLDLFVVLRKIMLTAMPIFYRYEFRLDIYFLYVFSNYKYSRAEKIPVFVFLLLLTFFAFYFHAKFHASSPKIDQVIAILVHDPPLTPLNPPPLTPLTTMYLSA